MKKTLILLIVLGFIASSAFAQTEEGPMMPPMPPAAVAPNAEVITVTGTIIDNMCADANKDTLSEFVKTHAKECALMPLCAESGYSILASDGKLMKFDKESSSKIAEFLKAPESKLRVVVEATKLGEELSLILIKNQ